MKHIIMFAAREAHLLMRGVVRDEDLPKLREDTARQFAIKADEAYLIYDEKGGITVVLVIPHHDGRNN